MLHLSPFMIYPPLKRVALGGKSATPFSSIPAQTVFSNPTSARELEMASTHSFGMNYGWAIPTKAIFPPFVQACHK